eukprot:CAMPEP_0116879862 /NCGR_PEP_ID=MMETSP0463-20121206/11709_1 /TAXON_ID=181622 /ORGANISM="Strombidinopsis sp, Strain SopsisLIS2011" /LENGTH=58 /DNA_ID=CAMNT_0004529701 /DNA_START=589 /DNA_END=765 /DNA_ORIENTATION=-
MMELKRNGKVTLDDVSKFVKEAPLDLYFISEESKTKHDDTDKIKFMEYSMSAIGESLN